MVVVVPQDIGNLDVGVVFVDCCKIGVFSIYVCLNEMRWRRNLKLENVVVDLISPNQISIDTVL